MSISLVQIIGDGGGSSPIVTSAPTTAGTLLVMCFSYPLTPTTVISVTDNAGNTWIQAPGATLASGNQYVSIWYCPNNLGGATHISWAGLNGGPDAVFSEWSGVNISSPISSTNTTSGSGTVVGPTLTTVDTTSLLISCMSVVGNETGANAPWIFFDDFNRSRIVGQAYLLPGSIGAFNSTYTPNTGSFISSGIVFLSSTATLTLSLFDSISLVDSLSPSFNISQNLSDSMSISDSAPQSFSVQSDFLVPVSVPVVEMLVNQLVPAHVKTYFRIEE